MSNDSFSEINKIIFNGKELELKTLSGTVGPSVVDIRSLYSDLGIFTYDPGYGSTGSCESEITYIDGEQGVLLHRGYPIDQLANKSSFLEVAYLLLNGELPKKPEKEEFSISNILYIKMYTLAEMIEEKKAYLAKKNLEKIEQNLFDSIKQKQSDKISTNVKKLKNSLESRDSYGGTSPKVVKKALKNAENTWLK